ncbi:ABC transporter permease [Treponema sp. J25]|uniref:ABC transporter permease n=1 Tax=Treponema sp. J25 TaxID=2094121 RepID=UPI00104C28AE|nr:ABC transporter permease [Treponema sp. J25]TCW62431.1 ABC transporter permease [Treponema sp. J25]
MIEAIIVEGLVYGILAIGVFISFRVLDFPDLTVEGSFPLGAAVAAAAVVGKTPFFMAAALALLAGALAGIGTALIHTRFRVPPLLAGIVMMTALYSVNLRVMGGRSNIQLIGHRPLIEFSTTWIPGLPADVGEALFFVVVVGLFIGLLDLFFHTELGLTMGALGDNEQMVIASASNPDTIKLIGVALSNSLVAFAGALASQHHGFADVNLGAGVVALGLASVMLGEILFRSNRIGAQLVRVVLGALLFKAIMFAARYYGYVAGITPNDLRLLTALMIILSLAIGRWKNRSLDRRSYRRSRSGFVPLLREEGNISLGREPGKSGEGPFMRKGSSSGTKGAQDD